jgi:hypothetical protein
VNQSSKMPTRKWWTAFGGFVVALVTEFLVSPTPGTETLHWDAAEWAILGAAAASLIPAYINRNAPTPTADGVPPAVVGPSA